MIYVHRAAMGREAKPWVARIGGIDTRFTFLRWFVRPRHDYRNAKSRRPSSDLEGVEFCFLLETGWVCEFFIPGRCGKKQDKRFFARVTDDETLSRMTDEEVISWLKTSRRSA